MGGFSRRVAARKASDAKLGAIEALRLAAKAAIEAAPDDIVQVDQVLGTHLAAIAQA